MARDVKELSWKEFIKQYDKEVHEAIINVRKREGVTGVATLQCEVLDSSRCGMLTAMIYGPSCTYKTVDDMLKNPGGVYPTGLPSSASFPINFTVDLPS
jgi:hypothetical protein